ncbi:hypothetical protein C7410_12929 [Paraburkholderia silvatlantica]|uniref:Glycosyltransferase involved in cell wall biosynthesis n=1 Tax=Paraburkholderia silvatlantica TaxID=321895 RepID=A0A2V4U4M2_9BURK|nr:glycosyltransferase [Paraburkholderia silvatlantica]PYE16588.1 hypothetical protein C7410_12929 [Paraburkholderia silvatlantica]
MNHRFSIVINTYNRASLLEDALLGLTELDYDAFEVIVVNGPSTDGTDAILQRWSDRIKLGHCAEPNLSMSRNKGIELASGDVVAFIDDDAVPHPSWLKRLNVHYSNPDVGGVGGFTIDNTGVAYQVRKTVCDRFGNAHGVSDFFDERPLSFPGTPLYPSLLGTNSSFRLKALKEIGGFDHTFAYLLDETDVCLRLIDAGYKVIYEPEALVYHQFAPSHIRSKNRVAKTLYPSAVSKSYFIKRHGLEADATNQLKQYVDEILTANKWLCDHNEITNDHRVSLDEDLLFGVKDGSERALHAMAANKGNQGDLNRDAIAPDFFPLQVKTGLRIALISKSYPPHQESGIARWTSMMASGLARLGHSVHVITLAVESPFNRYENGVWVHAVKEDHTPEAARLAALKGIPTGLAPWCSAVAQLIRSLKGFGLDVASFPIWDLEGMALVGDASIGVVMSLHTSYAMAKPFKPEWSERPLFGHFHVNRVIGAEKQLLSEVSHILANSQAIVDDLRQAYSCEFSDRVLIAPHGTPDLLTSETDQIIVPRIATGTVRVTYVGRFEPRKGFDLACSALSELLKSVDAVEVTIVGDKLTADARAVIAGVKAEVLLSDRRVQFVGQVTRSELDNIYRNSDVVLMPSRYESFGLVAIEAMAAGATVVAMAAGGLKEVVIDGETGFLVHPDSTAASQLAHKLIELATNSETLARLRANARRDYLARFTVDKMVEQAEKIYYRAAGK